MQKAGAQSTPERSTSSAPAHHGAPAIAGPRQGRALERRLRRCARLVDALGLPFVTSPIARGYIPDTDPLCFNAVRGAVQREADVVLLLGARLDWTFRHGSQIAAGRVVIQVDVHAPELNRNRDATSRSTATSRRSQGGARRVSTGADFSGHGVARQRASAPGAAQASVETDPGDSSERIAPTRVAQAWAGIASNAITMWTAISSCRVPASDPRTESGLSAHARQQRLPRVRYPVRDRAEVAALAAGRGGLRRFRVRRLRRSRWKPRCATASHRRRRRQQRRQCEGCGEREMFPEATGAGVDVRAGLRYAS